MRQAQNSMATNPQTSSKAVFVRRFLSSLLIFGENLRVIELLLVELSQYLHPPQALLHLPPPIPPSLLNA